MATTGLTPSSLGAERVALLSPDDTGAEWDAFVGAAQDATYCHLSGWRRILRDALGHDCHYLVAVNAQGAWQGVLPVVPVRSPLFGSYLVSMPFLNYGGPLGNPGARAVLELYVVTQAQQLGASLLELRNRHDVSDVLTTCRRKVTVLLDLAESPDGLWRRFPSKLRSQINRAEKAGLTARFGPDQRAPFYDVFARNMRDLGTPVLPAAWFERIGRVFPDLVEFGAVYHGDTPIAAGCGFRWRGEFEMTWASSLREFNHLAGNMLLYWSFMRLMIETGVRVLNFGRCSPGSGAHRFKRQWGGADVPLPWGQWSPGEVRATPSPDAGKYRLATAVWRHLPLPVANRLGPLVARVIP